MTRVFCDANVLFAAAISPEGRSRALVTLASARGHELLVSRHVIGEVRANLVARYPEAIGVFEAELLPSLAVALEAAPELVDLAREQGLPDTDVPVLAVAIACRADVLVTGDRRHFGHLYGREVSGVRVLSLKDAVELLL